MPAALAAGLQLRQQPSQAEEDLQIGTSAPAALHSKSLSPQSYRSCCVCNGVAPAGTTDDNPNIDACTQIRHCLLQAQMSVLQHEFFEAMQKASHSAGSSNCTLSMLEGGVVHQSLMAIGNYNSCNTL